MGKGRLRAPAIRRTAHEQENQFKFDDSGDSDDLQALFDSIAAQPGAAAARRRGAGAATMVLRSRRGAIRDELQALFDSVAGQAAGRRRCQIRCGKRMPRGAATTSFNRLGQMTRQLHDTPARAGLDRASPEAAAAIPDARQRLAYVAQMTEQAASRVLNATDIAKPIQDELQARPRWPCAGTEMFADQSVDEFKALAGDTRSYS
jgi:chemotaxis protein CheZ